MNGTLNAVHFTFVPFIHKQESSFKQFDAHHSNRSAEPILYQFFWSRWADNIIYFASGMFQHFFFINANIIFSKSICITLKQNSKCSSFILNGEWFHIEQLHCR